MRSWRRYSPPKGLTTQRRYDTVMVFLVIIGVAVIMALLGAVLSVLEEG